MKIALLTCVSWLAFSISASSQTVSPQVLNSTGNTAVANNIELSWSVGEMSIVTLTSPTTEFTEGFLQPDIYSTTAIEEIKISESITCYPNPAQDRLFIKQTGSAQQVGTVSIYSILGAKLYDQKYLNQALDMSIYLPGIYFINLLSPDGKESHLFKIVKL